jgi:hypothetical protein
MTRFNLESRFREARVVTVGMSPQIEGALAELQRYLQNEIPPDAGAGSVALLMAQPPEVVMQYVGTWSVEQARKHEAQVSDLLVHALKKIYIMGELNLLDREAIANYLDRVTGPAIRLCSTDDERAQLRAKLTKMRASKSTVATPIQIAIPAPPPPPPSPSLAFEEEDAQAARRLSLILERFGSAARNDTGVPAAPADPQAVAQMLTMAAASSKNGQQLNDYMDQIRPLAGAAGGNVFVILGGALPSWDLPQLHGTNKPPAQIGAMERIIDLADPVAALNHFRELVHAAVEKFNDGALPATLWMLDVAQNTITEKNLEVLTVNQICAEAADRISSVQLRKYVENKRQHAALRIALDFFPTLHMESLFRDLRGEPRAEKRRTLLGHIEAHHAAGRDFALTELEAELARNDVDTYYLRNTIYLLHRIPYEYEEGDGDDRETVALERASARGQNIYVVKEAATALGRIKTDKSLMVLVTRLAEFEAILLRGDTAAYPVAEMHKLLDRIVSSIARIGTPAAILTVARHGMKANPVLGDTRARLAGLSQHDLSFEEGAVDVLLKALRAEIPGKLLGRLLPRKQEGTVQLIEALSGTRSEATNDLFQEIADRFPAEEIGRAAAKALEIRTAAEKPARDEPAATLTGELEFFGLPSVVQSLADMRATGMLALSTKQGQTVAGLAFVEGKFLNAQKGPLRGAEAFYEILEKPVAGRFAFVPHPIEKMKSNLQPQDIIGLLLEGIRRHDELQQLIALIPDTLKLTKGSVKPTPHEEETDASLIREIWLKASTSTTLGEWDSQIPTDSYRVRRLIAHWLETGALVQMEA